MKDNYTWVPIYHKLALKVMEFENNPEGLKKLIFDVQKALSFNTESFQGEPMKCIDPLGFFSIIEKYTSNRDNFIAKFQELAGIDIEVPKDYTGLPSTMPLSAWLFKDEEDSKILWNVAKYALEYDKTKSKESKEKF